MQCPPSSTSPVSQTRARRDRPGTVTGVGHSLATPRLKAGSPWQSFSQVSHTVLFHIKKNNHKIIEIGVGEDMSTFHILTYLFPYSNCKKLVWWNFRVFPLSLSEGTKCVMYNTLPPIKPRGDPKLKFKVSIVMGCMQNELNKCWQVIGQKNA